MEPREQAFALRLLLRWLTWGETPGPISEARKTVGVYHTPEDEKAEAEFEEEFNRLLKDTRALLYQPEV